MGPLLSTLCNGVTRINSSAGKAAKQAGNGLFLHSFDAFSLMRLIDGKATKHHVKCKASLILAKNVPYLCEWNITNYLRVQSGDVPAKSSVIKLCINSTS